MAVLTEGKSDVQDLRVALMKPQVEPSVMGSCPNTVQATVVKCWVLCSCAASRCVMSTSRLLWSVTISPVPRRWQVCW